MPFVVKLNSRLAVTDAIVITANTRANDADAGTLAPVARRAGATASSGAMRAKAMPHAMDSSAGRANAARQPAYLTRRPVTTADSATPMLPASPLTPIVSPGRGESRTSIGMPTG